MPIYIGSKVKEIYIVDGNGVITKVKQVYLNNELKYQYDSVAPSITITGLGSVSSSPKYITNNSYNISGTCSDIGSGLKSVVLTITPNGGSAKTVAANISGNTWTANLTNIAGDVYTTIVATATDNAGLTSYDTGYIFYDSTAPSVSITTPISESSSSPTTTYSNSYMVRGTASDASGIKSVTVNNSNAGTNNWNKDVGLTTGNITTVTIIATDNAGRTTALTRYLKKLAAVSGTLSSTSVSNLGFTPNFCAFYFEGNGQGGHSSYGAVASAISNNMTGGLDGFGNITIDYMNWRSGTATFGNGTLSVSMNTGITVASTTGICGCALDAVFGSFNINNNSFTQTISTNFTPNFVVVCCDTIGTGGYSGYYFTLCGWTPSVGATTTSGGNWNINVSYNNSGVTLTANYQSNHRYCTVRYIVARV